MFLINQSVKLIINKQLRYVSYKKYLDYSRVPKLDENDLEEQWVKGSGPGGSCVNKSSNCVVLKHKPSGIVVKCHQVRDVIENSKRAREILITKLDNKLNAEYSIENQTKQILAKKAADRSRKRNKLQELKEAFKKREGID
ncbi:hypothetical protein KQX54_006759 [Cotesia glomerata]|uniref:Prokaryotic-type class I peptide chain release factors domain-containing protein n=1 Tax=Cotesia glomerata TaxID=32391 RepID=A0AAV7J504_COTGL|nr:hypothetical protein KQX54_006759 [Cotesia glomerata]